MGKMVDGTWRTDTWVRDNEGHFEREPTTFRNQVESRADATFPVARNRYHLYVSLACPWAHRTLIVRALMGLEEAIDVSVVHPHMLEEGWSFDAQFPGATGDLLYGLKYLREVYAMADENYTGRVTVPILWDKETRQIVNNESREIIRNFSKTFAKYSTTGVNLCPEGYGEAIDEAMDSFYEPINNGVYRSGFATTQEAYEESVTELFEHLQRWDDHLSKNRYICGEVLTEADVAMFTTLLRFDPVYYGHFKCNIKHVYEFENLWGHTCELYQLKAITATCDLNHIQSHYYYSHETINPTRVIPKGPLLDRLLPHGRDHLPGRIEKG